MLILRKVKRVQSIAKTYYSLNKKLLKSYFSSGIDIYNQGFSQIKLDLHDIKNDKLYKDVRLLDMKSKFKSIYGVFFIGKNAILIPIDDKAWDLITFVNEPVYKRNMDENYYSDSIDYPVKRSFMYNFILNGGKYHVNIIDYENTDSQIIFAYLPLSIDFLDRNKMFWSINYSTSNYVNISFFYDILSKVRIPISKNAEIYFVSFNMKYFKFDMNKDALKYITKRGILG